MSVSILIRGRGNSEPLKSSASMFKGLEAHPAGIHTGGKRCWVLTSTKTWIFLQPRVALQHLGMLQLPPEGSLCVTQKGHSQKLGNDAVSGDSSGKSGMGWCCTDLPNPLMAGHSIPGQRYYPRGSDSFNPVKINQVKQNAQELLVKIRSSDQGCSPTSPSCSVTDSPG